MKQFARIVATVLVAAALAGAGYAQTGTSSQTGSQPGGPPGAAARQVQPSSSPSATYTLTPERRAKAIAYSRTLYILYFVGTLVSIVIYLFLWWSGSAVTFRNWARKVSRLTFVQCLIAVPLFAAAASLLFLPLDFYSGYVLDHRFGLATQGLSSWFSDWGKSLGLVAAVGVPLAWVFYSIVRRSPRRWWFYFWLASIPIVLGFMVIEPYVVEPLFYRFTPLAQTHPDLVERIETMLQHAGLSIPPSQIFEMDASSRTNTLNAYVSGVGASKRVVIWDTTLNHMGPDELLLVLGHETGHYVMHHIPKEFALDEAVAFVFFYLGFLGANWMVRRFGSRSGIEGIGDLAALPALLVIATLVLFLSDPIVNGISRHFEHQADQFGLEVAHGVVRDPNAAQVSALQILGDLDLSDPDPNPFIKFWLYTHPPLDQRIRFAAAYRPWEEGKPLSLLPKHN